MLIAAAAKRPSLEVLDLSGNPLTDAEARRRAAKKANKVLGKLAKVASKITPPAPAQGDDRDALADLFAALGKGKFAGLAWLGLEDVGLTPRHRGLLAASVKARRKRNASSVVVESIGNDAAKDKRKEPVI